MQVLDHPIHRELSRLPEEILTQQVLDEKGKKCIAKIAADHQPESVVEMEFLALHQAAKALNRILSSLMYENKYRNAETFLKFSDKAYKELIIINYLIGVLFMIIDISDENGLK